MDGEVPHSGMQDSDETPQTFASRSDIIKFYILCIFLAAILNFVLFVAM